MSESASVAEWKVGWMDEYVDRLIGGWLDE